MRAIFTGFHLMYSRVFAETANGEQRTANSLFNLRQFMFSEANGKMHKSIPVCVIRSRSRAKSHRPNT